MCVFTCVCVCARACFCSYAGPHDADGRRGLMGALIADAAARGMPLSGDFDPVTFLVDPAAAAAWALMGLPAEPSCVGAAAIIARWCARA